MADIVIRDLDDSVVARLEARARETNQSLEEVVRSILSEAAQPSRYNAIRNADESRESIRARAGGDIPIDATDLIRQDRDSR
jgi:plasmid stability protein